MPSDRAADIERGQQVLVPLPQQHGIEREGGEGRVAAQHAGREEQPQMARRIAPPFMANQPATMPITIEPMMLIASVW